MTRFSRIRYAYRFIRDSARRGSEHLERTKARFVAATYGVEVDLVKRMKARFRNELSFSGEGK
jgi:hypothetical protein